MKNYLLKISILSIIAIAYITISLSIFPINNAYAKQYNSKFQTSNQTSISNHNDEEYDSQKILDKIKNKKDELQVIKYKVENKKNELKTKKNELQIKKNELKGKKIKKDLK